MAESSVRTRASDFKDAFTKGLLAALELADKVDPVSFVNRRASERTKFGSGEGGPQWAVAPGDLAFELKRLGLLSGRALRGLRDLGIDLDKLGLGSAGLVHTQEKRLADIPEIVRDSIWEEHGIHPQRALELAAKLGDRIAKIERRLELDRPFAPNPLEVPVRLKPPKGTGRKVAGTTEDFLEQYRMSRLEADDFPVKNILPRLRELRAETHVTRDMGPDEVRDAVLEALEAMQAKRRERQAKVLRDMFELIEGGLPDGPKGPKGTK